MNGYNKKVLEGCAIRSESVINEVDFKYGTIFKFFLINNEFFCLYMINSAGNENKFPF